MDEHETVIVFSLPRFSKVDIKYMWRCKEKYPRLFLFLFLKEPLTHRFTFSPSVYRSLEKQNTKQEDFLSKQ
jgi:hypothetical protein